MYSYCFHELPVALEKKGKFREALAKELKLQQEQIFNLANVYDGLTEIAMESAYIVTTEQLVSA